MLTSLTECASLGANMQAGLKCVEVPVETKYDGNCQEAAKAFSALTPEAASAKNITVQAGALTPGPQPLNLRIVLVDVRAC